MPSLYDFMMENGHEGGCDCYDENYDFPQICMIPIPEEEDTYDVVNNWILRNTELVSFGKITPEYDTVGDFAKLVKDHLEQFKRFSELFNKEGYIIKGEDEDSIYAGCCTIHSLMAGYYGDEQYDRFCCIFDLVPEDHVIHNHRIMDIDEMLATEEREAYDPGRDEA